MELELDQIWASNAEDGANTEHQPAGCSPYGAGRHLVTHRWMPKGANWYERRGPQRPQRHANPGQSVHLAGLGGFHSEDAGCTMAIDTKGVYDISVISCHDAVANWLFESLSFRETQKYL